MEQDYNKNNFTTIREQNDGNSIVWYIVLAVVILGLLGWFGYSKGWFSPRGEDLIIIDQIPQTETNPDAVAAQVDDFTIQILESFPVQVMVRATGYLSDGCSVLQEPVSFRDGNVFYVNLDVHREGEVCTQALVPYEIAIPLQVVNLPAGVYIVNVNGQEKTFELTSQNTIDFSAGSDK